MPALHTGWIGDDAKYSYLPAAIDTGRVTLAGAAQNSYAAWLASAGRWHPGLVIETYVTFAFIQDRIAYKGFLIAISLLALSAGADFARRLWGWPFALVAILATIACFQIRGYHDPFLAYNGLIQAFAILTFFSLSAFASFVKKRAWRDLIISVACYFLACTIYEIGYIFAPVYIVIALADRKTQKFAAASTAPFALLGAALLAIAAVLRARVHVDPASLYAIHPDLGAYASGLGDQLTAALPLSYLLLNPSKIFTPFYNGFNIAFNPAIFVVGAVCAYVVFPKEPISTEASRRNCAIAIGCLLIVLPALEVPALLKYQQELKPGLGYLPVFVEYFGTGLLIATLLTSVRQSRALHIGVAAAFAFIAMLDAGASDKLAAELRVPYLTSRESFELALDRGLLDTLPPSSRIAIVPQFPWVCNDGTCIDDIRTSDMVTDIAKRNVAVVPPATAKRVVTYDEKTDRWFLSATPNP